MSNNYSNKDTGNGRRVFDNIPDKSQANTHRVAGNSARQSDMVHRSNEPGVRSSIDNKPSENRNNISMNMHHQVRRPLKKNHRNVDWGDEIVNALKLVGRVSLRILGYIVNVLLTVLLIGILAGTIIVGAFLYYVSNYVDGDMTDFDTMLVDQDASTSIYYMNWTNRETGVGEEVEIDGQRLYASENRSIVSYNSVPKDLINAYVAIEDHRFWTHEGVDWIRTIRATVSYFTGSKDFGGASTITQQVVKNVTQDDDVTIQRKAQEIVRALNLENEKSKEQIMEAYLNLVYSSRGCYGVQAAAYTYFGKDVKDLSLLECVAIAGITQAPSKYDPVSNPANNKVKRQSILKAMLKYGYINQEQYDDNYDADLVLNYQKGGDMQNSSATVMSWYTEAAYNEARDLIMESTGMSQALASQYIYTGGLKIVTAQNYEIQQALEAYYEDENNFDRVSNSGIQPESAMVIMDPKNGDVVALVGSRGKKTQNLISNLATQTVRSPGSSIKPLSVYAPALEYGLITYGSVVDDTPFNFGEEVYDEETGEFIGYSRPDGYPNNYSNTYRGLTTIKYAVANSLNTVAIKVLDELTLDKSFDFVKNKLHIDSFIDNYERSDGTVLSDKDYSALALGGMNFGVTLLEMTAAYQIFPNKGVYNEPHIVLKITDKTGKVIVDRGTVSEVVISEQNATIMTKLLQNVVTYGTANKITLKNRVDTAGKTGTTTQDNDRWFVGYTPYYVAGVWFGYTMPQSLSAFSASYSPAIKIWDGVMNIVQDFVEAEANESGEEIKNFSSAPGVIECRYCMDSGMLPTSACSCDPRGSRTEMGYFTMSTLPMESCDVHVMVDFDVYGGVANSACTSTKKYALLRVEDRDFPVPVTIFDAQYTYRELPDGVLPCQDEYRSFYDSMLGEGRYSGSSGDTHFNRGCTIHIPDISSIPTVETGIINSEEPVASE